MMMMMIGKCDVVNVNIVQKITCIWSLRIAKEKVMYEKEVVQQTAKVEKMKAENKDEHDIKKQVCWVSVML